MKRRKRKWTEEELQAWAEDHPTVKLLRELAAKIDVELAAKQAGRPAPQR